MTIEPFQQRATRPASDRIDIDRICKLLGVWTFEKWDDANVDSFYPPRESVEDELRRQGVHGGGDDEEPTEDQIDALAMAWETAERDEAWGKYRNAVMSVADEVFGEHGLTLVPVPPKGKRARKDWEERYAFDFRIEPVTSWSDAASKLLTTINGMGPFWWPNLRNFLSSGPYTAREAVLQHLGWIPDWYRVYGNGTASSAVDRSLR